MDKKLEERIKNSNNPREEKGFPEYVYEKITDYLRKEKLYLEKYNPLITILLSLSDFYTEASITVDINEYLPLASPKIKEMVENLFELKKFYLKNQDYARDLEEAIRNSLGSLLPEKEIERLIDETREEVNHLVYWNEFLKLYSKLLIPSERKIITYEEVKDYTTSKKEKFKKNYGEYLLPSEEIYLPTEEEWRKDIFGKLKDTQKEEVIVYTIICTVYDIKDFNGGKNSTKEVLESNFWTN